MLRLKFLVIISLFTAFKVVLAQDDSNKMSAVTIIENAIDRKGGSDYLKSIKSLYVKSESKYLIDELCYSARVDCILIDKYQTPNKSSKSIIVKDSVLQKVVFDGLQRIETPHRELDSTYISDYLEQNSLKKNIFDELNYIDSSIWEIKLLKDDLINNQEVYKISAKQTTGIIRILYYSKSDFYLLKSVEFKNENSENYIMIDYFDYKNYGSLLHYSKSKIYDDFLIEEHKIVDLKINEGVTEMDFK
jgi:hypothetical protein